MSSVKRTAHEVGALVSNVIDATNGLQPWELPQSVLGRVRRAAPPRYSEYAMFVERDVGRTARYLTNVLVPSLQRVGPSWVPSALRRVFFHETTIQRRPDHLGSYDSFPAEHWFFINGILTDSGMAGWNADYLARIFHRSFTIVQNATDGPLADLLECADEKAFGMNGEPADVAFPEIHRALKDPTKDRVIIIGIGATAAIGLRAHRRGHLGGQAGRGARRSTAHRRDAGSRRLRRCHQRRTPATRDLLLR
jgi:hypothetical protein